ncbi:RCC1 domain-containing protein [Paenibacillus chitinolyticus]|uniref:RCC1 domain-containing protein n=1 Tax=Paenibacillus chitinolyticus TaxID=79263 RepID=UPI00363FF7E7
MAGDWRKKVSIIVCFILFTTLIPLNKTEGASYPKSEKTFSSNATNFLEKKDSSTDNSPQTPSTMVNLLPSTTLLTNQQVALNVYADTDKEITQTKGVPGGQPALLQRTVAKMVGGKYHTMVLKEDGLVWSWGQNSSGQLGDGTTMNHAIPQKIINLDSIVDIAAGASHSLALKNDGTVWAWGGNLSGQLGEGSNNNMLVPQQVKNLDSVVSIAAGSNHSIALKSDGTVWSWGSNVSGQLGIGTNRDQMIATQVLNLNNVVMIKAGGNTSIALKNDGTVWSWGNNSSGQLGDGTKNNRLNPVKVNSLASIISIASGSSHSLAISNEGKLWAWGSNNYGELGDGSTISRPTPIQISNVSSVTSIAAGSSYSLVLKNDGTVWSWGLNANGQLGGGDTSINQTSPQRIVSLNGITSISIGTSHSGAITDTGNYYTWGWNNNGQLGDGTNRDSSIPLHILFGKETMAPKAPVLKISGSTYSGVTQVLMLSWENSKENTGVMYFEIYNNSVLVSRTEGTLTKFDLYVAKDAPYSVNVRAVNLDGKVSPLSNTISGPLDTIPPTVPSGLKVRQISRTSAELYWNASTDNVGVTAYNLYNGNALLTSSSTTSYTLQNLSANSLYVLRVKASDAANNESGASNTIYMYTGNYTYFYDLAGRIDYILFSSGQKLKYNFDANGNILGHQLQ